MMNGRLLASVVFAGTAGIAGAQQNPPPVFEVQSQQAASSVLTVDIDRLFLQSAFGERVSQSYNDARAELGAENRRIAEALREEELALTQARTTMAPDVFRAEAAAFDEKAQGIRRAQDAKEAALESTLSEGRTQFLEVTRPILGQLMVDRGAFAILDRRSILLSLGSIDVTDDAIARIDEAIGDGTTPATDDAAPQDASDDTIQDDAQDGADN